MSNNKHIVLVGNTACGMYNFRGGLVSFLIEHGYKVTVIAPDDANKHIFKHYLNLLNQL